MSAQIQFLGRLGRDPSTKQVGDSQVCSLAVAVDNGWGDRKTTSWYNVAVWGKPAAAAQAQLAKGGQVFIAGELVPREYDSKDGARKTALDVRAHSWQHVGPPNGNASRGGNPAPGGYAQPQPQPQPQPSQSARDLGTSTERYNSRDNVRPAAPQQPVNDAWTDDDIPF